MSDRTSRDDLIEQAIVAANEAIKKARYITTADSAGTAALAIAKAGEVLLQAAALRNF